MLRLTWPLTKVRWLPATRVNQRWSSTIGNKEYDQLSEKTLEDLCDKFDSMLEDKGGADVSLSNNVLTVLVDQDCVYVINKQTPNRQIWFSSPLSGPKRFDLSEDGKWIDRHSKKTLQHILSDEFSQILKKPVRC